MIFASHTILPTILIAAQASDYKHSLQLVWYKTNNPIKARNSVVATHENILILAADPAHFVCRQIAGLTSHQQTVIGHPRMNHPSKDDRGRVLNSCEKPWALLFRLLYSPLPAPL